MAHVRAHNGRTRMRALIINACLLLGAAPQRALSKGSGGGGSSMGGRATGARATYGGGGRVSSGYTRSYFIVFAGSRHGCSGCQRTSAANSGGGEHSYPPRMAAELVLAELDVSFAAPEVSVAELGLAEAHVEAAVAATLSAALPDLALSTDDVMVRDHWRANCTGAGGVSEQPSATYMFEVGILAGEAGTGVGARIADALMLCSAECDGGSGSSGNASWGSGGGGGGCTAAEHALLAGTRLDSCCTQHSAARQMRQLSGGGEPPPAGVALLPPPPRIHGSRISDCGNITVTEMTLGSEVEYFGAAEASRGRGHIRPIVMGLGLVLLMLCSWGLLRSLRSGAKLGEWRFGAEVEQRMARAGARRAQAKPRAAPAVHRTVVVHGAAAAAAAARDGGTRPARGDPAATSAAAAAAPGSSSSSSSSRAAAGRAAQPAQRGQRPAPCSAPADHHRPGGMARALSRTLPKTARPAAALRRQRQLQRQRQQRQQQQQLVVFATPVAAEDVEAEAAAAAVPDGGGGGGGGHGEGAGRFALKMSV
jgi:hypothetical protein